MSQSVEFLVSKILKKSKFCETILIKLIAFGRRLEGVLNYNKPYLTSSERRGPTSLSFGTCLVATLSLSQIQSQLFYPFIVLKTISFLDKLYNVCFPA